MNVPIYGFTQNIALNKPVVTSSVSGSRTGNLAVDGSTSTRWSSVASDPQWIYVDLGSQYNITSVKITWSSAYGKNYTIDVSNNATSWNTINGITTASSDLTGFTPGTDYQFKVQTVCSAGSSSYSTVASFTTATSCDIPTGLTSSNIATTSATVSWTDVPGAATYNLQWKASTSST